MKELSTYLTEKLQAKQLKTTLGNPWYEIKNDKYRCQIMRFDEPSTQYGIDGGRISKLWIQDIKTKKIVANYDRGWESGKEPAGDVKKFYNEIIKEYN